MKLSRETIALLEDIERRIDPQTEEDFIGQWRDFLWDRFDGEVFNPERKKISPPSADFAPVHVNDTFGDLDLMLRFELLKISDALNHRHRNLAIRANYGTGILSSVFGAEIIVMDRKYHTNPTTRAIGGTEKMRALTAAGIPDLRTGFGKDVFDFGELCRETFRAYPKIEEYVRIYHPDVQGPLDICELLWGGDMFYEMYDDPDFVHEALSLITETYAAFLDKWYEIVPKNTEMNPHWTDWAYLWHRGTILLRCDSAVNLSPAFYREFSAPYDSRLMARFGGGCVHFCGRGDHYIETLCKIPGVYGINMSQPHLNDMETIFRHTVDRGIKLLAFNKGWAEKLKNREGGYRHNLSI
ncbi:MAG: hypothetical protein IJD59_06895 [Clostridia bacterium]|nr:hypothetical protein [Clostridia bacterium]